MTQLDENLKRQLVHDEGRLVVMSLPAPEHVAYQDTEGHWTIGYGFNLDDETAVKSLARVTKKEREELIAHTDRLTDAEAQELLGLRTKIATDDAADLIKNFESLSDARKLAVISMSFQMGKTKFSGFINTIAALDSSDFQRAADEMMSSRWAGQARRRARALSTAVRVDAYPATALPPPEPAPASVPKSVAPPAPPADKPSNDEGMHTGRGVDHTDGTLNSDKPHGDGGDVHFGGTLTIDRNGNLKP